MKNIFIGLSVIVFILLSGCNDKQLTVISSEAWHDLMPGAGGKTHLNIILKPEGFSPDEVKIMGIKLSWENNVYELKKGEWEAVSADSTINIKAAFLMSDNEAGNISAEISGMYQDGNELKQNISNIKIDKVY